MHKIAVKSSIIIIITLCCLLGVAITQDLNASVGITLLSDNVASQLTADIPHDGTANTMTASVILTAQCSDAPYDSLKIVWACSLSQNTHDTQELQQGAIIEITLPQGTHSCQTTVLGESISKSKTVEITVAAEPNTAPVAIWNTSAPVSFTIPHDGDPTTNTALVQLKGVATDADGDDHTSQWVCGTEEFPEVVVEISRGVGTHTCDLTVTDAYGATGTLQKVITVTAEPNTAPVAAAVASSTSSGMAVILDASSSTDADADPLQYVWDCGNGATATGEKPTVQLSAVGIHTCQLTVTDRYGSTNSVATSVQIV